MSGDLEWAEKLIRRARELAARNATVTRNAVTPPTVTPVTGERNANAERQRRYRKRKRQHT